jgi:hypothetical protein
LKSRSNPKPRQYVEDCGEMHQPTKFDVPIILFPRWLPVRHIENVVVKKNAVFSYMTTPNCTYSIKLVIVALCFETARQTEKVKTIYMPTFYESVDIKTGNVMLIGPKCRWCPEAYMFTPG